jgi:hypothetical protein
MTGSAKQSIHPLCRAMDCFAALAMTTEVQHNSVNWNQRCSDRRAPMRENLFIIFVDGMFTTFITCLFTNTSRAIRENPAMSCV